MQMANAVYVLLALTAVVLCHNALAQPLGTSTVEKDTRGERLERESNGYTGFVFDLFTGARQEPSANGFQTQNNVGTNSFTHTITYEGTAQNLLNLGACAGNSPHNHPRGPEISFVVRGKIEFGFIEENGAGGNKLVVVDALAGQIVHIPQGLMHFSHNLECEQASFLANFPARDPGTQTTWHSLMAIPTPILAASLNIADNQVESERIINALKRRAQVRAPSTGGAECMAKCYRSKATGRTVDANYYRLNGFDGPPVDGVPIIARDQVGNPQNFSAGGVVNRPPVRCVSDGECYPRVDFLGLNTIGLGSVNGLSMARQLLADEAALKTAFADLPQDKITVMNMEDVVGRVPK